jgi:hypothetical protein
LLILPARTNHITRNESQRILQALRQHKFSPKQDQDATMVWNIVCAGHYTGGGGWV